PPVGGRAGRALARSRPDRAGARRSACRACPSHPRLRSPSPSPPPLLPERGTCLPSCATLLYRRSVATVASVPEASTAPAPAPDDAIVSVRALPLVAAVLV